MATVTDAPLLAERTLADVLEELGNIPPSRILMNPPLGTATEADVLAVDARKGLAPELIDGVLVEKTVGYLESMLAMALAAHLRSFVIPRKLGIVLGPDGTLRILPRQVRVPDICYISWKRFPGGKLIKAPIPAIAPDLAAEILSEGNTPGEMSRKLRNYFEAGVQLVWYIDPRSRKAEVFTAVDDVATLDESGILSGGNVLPGFELPLKTLFAELDG